MSERMEQIEKGTVEARQGVTGHNVRYVLVVGTASVVVLFGVIWLWSFR